MAAHQFRPTPTPSVFTGVGGGRVRGAGEIGVGVAVVVGAVGIGSCDGWFVMGGNVKRSADRPADFLIECEDGIIMTLPQLGELEIWAIIEAS